MMLEHRVRIKPHLIGMYDLYEDLPRHAIVGLLRRTLAFGIDAKP